MTKDNFGTWLEIDLPILTNNFKIISKATDTLVMPVIKANAYGHGLERTAQCLERAGAKWFGVARIEEALLLREIGIRANILVLGYTSPVRVPHAIKENIVLTVYDQDVVLDYAQQAEKISEKLTLHVKIDTGMGRLGFITDQAYDHIALIAKHPYLELQGVFTHFACADEPTEKTTSDQLTRFKSLLDNLNTHGIYPTLIHAANSAGALAFMDSRFNMVRVGIAVFGLSPSEQIILPDGVKPCLSWKTRLISIKTLPEGHGVSYGFRYITRKQERIGVIAAGYGDGLRRVEGNQVLIRGKRANVVGNVCMDQCMVQLDGIPEAKIGDEVVLVGTQDGQKISVSEVAKRWETIPYEVICGLAARMPRYYIKNTSQ